MVTLDREHNLNKIVRFRGNDVPLSTVMTFLLVRSDNEAAEFLARSYAGGRQQFINMMNVKSRELGMTRTWFDDPSGRSSNNVSTVDDINTMVQKGKTKRWKGKPYTRTDVKKAVVTLAEGQSIDVTTGI